MEQDYDFRCTPPMRLHRALVEAREYVRDAADAHIRSHGLSTYEFDCLVTLGVDQPLRMCDLAQRSLVTKSHATQIVKQLEAKELIRRQRSPESDREVLVSLTGAGETLFREIYPSHFECLRTICDRRLSPSEQEQLTALLRKLADG